jgi:proteasome lid subunit RPN8/RPN11
VLPRSRALTLPVASVDLEPEGLWFRQEHLRQIMQWGYTGLRVHREVCGILIGQVGRVEKVRMLRNANPLPRTRYAFDPQEQASWWDRVDREGLEVLGVWHTHLYGDCTMSETDIAYAMPWLRYLVLSMRDPCFELWSVGTDALGTTGADPVPWACVLD